MNENDRARDDEQHGPEVPPPVPPGQPPTAPLWSGQREVPPSQQGPPPLPGEEALPEEPAEPVEPAEFPSGFWARIDYMLHCPERIIESLRRGIELGRMSGMFLVITLVAAAIYGAVMGGTNLLQASPMETGRKLLMIVTSAIKVPVLFLLALGIVLLPVYVANTFVGPRLTFGQLRTVALTSTALMAIVLASTATVAFFFAITSRSYHFIKSLHVVFFAYAALVGVRFFQKSIRVVTPLSWRHRLGRLFLPAFLLYAFVGMELTWVLRPFVGNPDMDFMLFRPRYGSFYESVVHSIGRGLREKISGREQTNDSDAGQGTVEQENGATGAGQDNTEQENGSTDADGRDPG